VITVRPAQLDDLETLADLARSFIEKTRYARFLSFDRATVLQFLQLLLVRGLLVVAEPTARPGQLVGFVAAVYGHDPIGGTKMLDELAWWVEPVYRNGRTGPKLLRALEAWAQANGVNTITMKAPVDTDVGRFYERHGYEPVETVHFKRLTHGADDRSVAGGRDPERLESDAGRAEEDRSGV
jgi:GNAT superfamily N-acetyltransferase